MRAANTASAIVNISDYRSNGKEQIERWLEEKIRQKHGEKSDLLENPLVRILTKFDALDSKAQYELCGYARGCILGIDGDLSLREKFWSIIDKGGYDDGSWKNVEEFADKLLLKSHICKVHEAVRG